MTANPPPFELVVYGNAQPQGSKRIGRHGKHPVILENNDATLRPWRGLVAWTARTAGARRPFEGPVALGLAFTLARPKSAPKRRRYPDRRPDLSKLVRAVEDSLTTARIWYDDGQVVASETTKRYVGDPDALDRPGVTIVVRAV